MGRSGDRGRRAGHVGVHRERVRPCTRRVGHARGSRDDRHHGGRTHCGSSRRRICGGPVPTTGHTRRRCGRDGASLDEDAARVWARLRVHRAETGRRMESTICGSPRSPSRVGCRSSPGTTTSRSSTGRVDSPRFRSDRCCAVTVPGVIHNVKSPVISQTCTRPHPAGRSTVESRHGQLLAS